MKPWGFTPATPLCGAKTRLGAPCKKRACWSIRAQAYTRCEHHGGRAGRCWKRPPDGPWDRKNPFVDAVLAGQPRPEFAGCSHQREAARRLWREAERMKLEVEMRREAANLVWEKAFKQAHGGLSPEEVREEERAWRRMASKKATAAERLLRKHLEVFGWKPGEVAFPRAQVVQAFAISERMEGYPLWDAKFY